MAFVHGATDFSVLCRSVFKFLCGSDVSQFVSDIEEVPEGDIKQLIIQVCVDL